MNKIKNTIWQLLITGILLVTPLITSAQTELINLGTLDIRLENGEEKIDINIKPGESLQKNLQISNFSSQDKKLSIYVTDAKFEKNSFIANDQRELSKDIKGWITIPTQQLELDSGESKILSVNINAPENAGVGMHTGAIMVKEIKSSNEKTINIEKGIRVYANVEGNPVTNFQFENLTTDTSEKFVTFNSAFLNQGNTDIKGRAKLQIVDIFGNTFSSQDDQLFVKPGEKHDLNLAVQKPTLGLYQSKLIQDFNDTVKTSVLDTKFYLPTEIALLFIMIIIGISTYLYLFKRKTIKTYAKNIKKSSIKNYLKNDKFRKSIGFALLFSLSVITVLSLKSMHTDSLKTNLLQEISPENNWYDVTIKYGNINNQSGSKNLYREFKGTIKFDNAEAELNKKLDMERNDRITFSNNTATLDIEASNDIDGIEVNLKPEYADKYPTITIEEKDKNNKITVSLEDILKSSKKLQFGPYGFEISVKTNARNEAWEEPPFEKEKLIKEQNSTEELNFQLDIDQLATAEINEEILKATPDLTEDLNALNEIFDEIPSSPEILSNYILDSDYVEQVKTENSLTQVNADPALLEALKQTPLTISEITATPELNFVFIPNQKIQFSPQRFSFENTQSSSQSLGELIFVQNKSTPWNTYVTVTNLISVNGRHTIPASSIKIIPGEINMISNNGNGLQINKGEARNLSGAYDESLLVSIEPQADTEAIFTMSPRVNIEVPPGTPPGLYKAEISIKTL
ncbi:DUF916 domain-containing protein [Candidatus Peregrinibacteria bacterium]|nr:DUF916 domain-containing protein [Candidatus Peregrinibacteria bacterium]